LLDQWKPRPAEKRMTTVLWIYIVLLATVILTRSGLLGIHKIEGTWFAVTSLFWYVFGAVFLFIPQINKSRFEVIKGVELRLAALEERLESRSNTTDTPS
jgi:hypothetical protein